MVGQIKRSKLFENFDDSLENRPVKRGQLESFEPVTRDDMRILESLQNSTFENALNVVEEFFGQLRLLDSRNTFVCAVESFDQLLKSFDDVDINHDRSLSPEEVRRFAHTLSGAQRVSFEFLDKNLDALCRSKLISCQGRGLDKATLLTARDSFRSLEVLSRKFFELGTVDAGGLVQVSEEDVLAYLMINLGDLNPKQIAELIGLIDFLRRLRTACHHDCHLHSADVSDFLSIT